MGSCPMEKLRLWRLQYRVRKCWDELEQMEFRLNFKSSEIRNSQSRKTYVWCQEWSTRLMLHMRHPTRQKSKQQREWPRPEDVVNLQEKSTKCFDCMLREGGQKRTEKHSDTWTRGGDCWRHLCKQNRVLIRNRLMTGDALNEGSWAGKMWPAAPWTARVWHKC